MRSPKEILLRPPARELKLEDLSLAGCQWRLFSDGVRNPIVVIVMASILAKSMPCYRPERFVMGGEEGSVVKRIGGLASQMDPKSFDSFIVRSTEPVYNSTVSNQ